MQEKDLPFDRTKACLLYKNGLLVSVKKETK